MPDALKYCAHSLTSTRREALVFQVGVGHGDDASWESFHFKISNDGNTASAANLPLSSPGRSCPRRALCLLYFGHARNLPLKPVMTFWQALHPNIPDWVAARMAEPVDPCIAWDSAFRLETPVLPGSSTPPASASVSSSVPSSRGRLRRTIQRDKFHLQCRGQIASDARFGCGSCPSTSSRINVLAWLTSLGLSGNLHPLGGVIFGFSAFIFWRKPFSSLSANTIQWKFCLARYSIPQLSSLGRIALLAEEQAERGPSYQAPRVQMVDSLSGWSWGWLVLGKGDQLAKEK